MIVIFVGVVVGMIVIFISTLHNTKKNDYGNTKRRMGGC
jgi:hypothetical protein